MTKKISGVRATPHSSGLTPKQLADMRGVLALPSERAMRVRIYELLAPIFQRDKKFSKIFARQQDQLFDRVIDEVLRELKIKKDG